MFNFSPEVYSGLTILSLIDILHCSTLSDTAHWNCLSAWWIFNIFSLQIIFLKYFSLSIYSPCFPQPVWCTTELGRAYIFFLLNEFLIYSHLKIYSESLIYIRHSIFSLLPPAGVMHNWAWARHDSSSRLGTKPKLHNPPRRTSFVRRGSVIFCIGCDILHYFTGA